MRSQSLQHLKLKAVIKESHCSPVQHLDMNMCDTDCRNLFATVGKDQATIYDDMHMGDHIAVVANLALSNNPESAKDVFHACCWVKTAGLTQHPYGDALLAVGGSDPAIHIISVVEAAVVGQLPLPAGASIAELSAAAHCPGLLLVLYRDGTLQLWQIGTGTCLWSCRTDAFVAALHPQGSCVLTSARNGKLSCWDLQGIQAAAAASRPSDSSVAVTKAAWVEGQHADSPVDCIRFLSDQLVATKTCDGHMAVHSWPSGKRISSWKVPGSGSSSTASYSKRCCFGHTQDGRYICVGNHLATAYVYDTTTGRQVSRVEAIRVQGSVRACGLSDDCRHLLMSVGHGYVFRFEARLPADQDAEEDGDAAGGDGTAAAAADPSEPQQPQQQQQPHSQPVQQQQVQPSLRQDGSLLPQHEQQQQQVSSLPDSEQAADNTPQHAAGSAPTAQWQLQQDTPGELMDVDLAEPPSAGSLDALMGVDVTPSTAEGAGAANTTSRQQQAALAAGVAGQHLHKKPRGAGAAADDSPLVFRPTPRRQ